MEKYVVRPARDVVSNGGRGWAVYVKTRGRRPQRVVIGPGEANWWPTRKEALAYKAECEAEDKTEGR